MQRNSFQKGRIHKEKGLYSAENRRRKIEMDKDFAENMKEELQEMAHKAKEKKQK